MFSVHPLKIYIFKNGLARFCTSAFEKPTKSNLKQKRMHLTKYVAGAWGRANGFSPSLLLFASSLLLNCCTTNPSFGICSYAVNKHSKHFQQPSGENSGSKRTLAAVMKQLDDTGRCASRDVWTQICDIVVKTLLSIQPKLSASYKSFFGEKDELWGPKCFEVLGFDIMLDASGRAWLFEVNHAPSFATGSPLDREIKHALISSTLILVDVTNEKKRAFLRHDKLEWSKRLWKTQPAIGSKKSSIQDPAKLKGGTEGGASSQTQQQVVPSETIVSKDDASLDRPEEEPDGQGSTGICGGGGGGAIGDSDDGGGGSSDVSSGSGPASDNQDDTDDESDDNQSPGQHQQIKSLKDPAAVATSLSAPQSLGATASVKLPIIRTIFQKKNRVLPCNPPSDTDARIGAPDTSAISSDSNNSTQQPISTTGDTVTTTAFFTNEFELIYPVADPRIAQAGKDTSTTDASIRRLLYDKILVAADVNKSKLWG